jgi:hypothetical protein
MDRVIAALAALAAACAEPPASEKFKDGDRTSVEVAVHPPSESMKVLAKSAREAFAVAVVRTGDPETIEIDYSPYIETRWPVEIRTTLKGATFDYVTQAGGRLADGRVLVVSEQPPLARETEYLALMVRDATGLHIGDAYRMTDADHARYAGESVSVSELRALMNGGPR